MNQTITQKIESLATVMTSSERADGTVFKHFTETAPASLKDIFRDNYEVRDLDYEIFSKAIDIMVDLFSEAYVEEEIDERIYELSADTASVYIYDRLAYLNIWNQEEISDILKEHQTDDIQSACAVWYDKEVERACFFIRDWVNA